MPIHFAEVSVPCFVPVECGGCNSKNTLNLEPSNEVSVIVCTLDEG